MQRYFLECDYGKNGRESIIDYDKCSRSDILHTIIRGDYGSKNAKVVAVYCWEPDKNRIQDVTEDIVHEILNRPDYIEYSKDARIEEFIEDTLTLIRGAS